MERARLCPAVMQGKYLAVRTPSGKLSADTTGGGVSSLLGGTLCTPLRGYSARAVNRQERGSKGAMWLLVTSEICCDA